MTIEILMPALSPTMKEGVLANWLKSEGDIIEPGDVIAEIETDKATMEVEAVDEGILGKILVASGTENVAINTPIALMLEDGEDNSVLDSYKVSAPKSADNPTKEEVSTEKEEEKVVTPLTTETLTVARSALNDRIYASPLAKRVAAENNVSLGNLVGSGPHGRIIKNDVLSAEVGQKSGTIQRHPEEYHAVKNNNIRKVIGRSRMEKLIELGVIEIVPIAFARGRSIDNSIILIDEAQNISMDNIRTLMTRIGNDSKMVIMGDVRQKDIRNKKDSSLEIVLNKFKNVEGFGTVELRNPEDVVRNPIIKVIEDVFENIED